MDQKWKTDKWYTSAWNFNEDIVSEYKFPKQIKIHDTTLRDGEQQTGVVFNYDDKIRIAEKLAEAGVHRIEVGMPAVSEQDERAIRDLAKRNLGSEIFAFSRCMVEDVKRAADCGVKGIVIEIPSSEHIIKHAYQWPLEKAIELSIKATTCAKENGLKTIFFTIDASRADINWLTKIIKGVATDGHMDGLTLVDTMGVLTPDAVKYFVTEIKKSFGNIPLEAHFHNDFNMAVINTITALSLGVEVAHTTVCGLGERSGGAALEDVVVALLTLYGVDTGVKLDKLYELSKLVVELSNHKLPVNKSMVGDFIYKIESGIPASWIGKCKGDLITEVFPIRWDLVGQGPPEIVLGKGSGEDSIKTWLDKVNVSVPEDRIKEITLAVKQKSIEKKGLLSKEDFLEILKEKGLK